MRTGLVAGSLVLVALCLLSVGAGAAAVGTQSADADYNVTVADAVDGPTRTISFEGTTFELSAVARRAPGESVTATVSAPADTGYDLYLYDADRSIQATARQTGPGAATFQTDGLEPGSYVIAVYKQGEFRDVFPVVVTGYDVAVTAPDEPVTDRRAEIEVELTPRGERDRPDAVEVVLANGSETIRTTATATEGTRYVASVPVAGRSPGEYRVFAVATERRSDAVDQVLGVSDAGTVTIGETPAPNGSATDDRNPSGNESGSSPGGAADVLSPNDSFTTTRADGQSTAPAALAVLLAAYGLVVASRRRR
ncbi:hypothetical protein [Halorientalis halophila]|uniref:hypothetical protein n=1 Tax=Halorientalis halophila TaxID=3108499 RepID=UPI003008CAAF